MNTLKYAFKSITKKKITAILIIIQFIITTLLTYILIFNYYDTNNIIMYMEKNFIGKEAVKVNVNNLQKLSSDEKKLNDVAYKTIQYIETEINGEFVMLNPSTNLAVEEFQEINKFQDEYTNSSSEEGYKFIKSFTINENANNLLNLKMYKGNMFSKDQYVGDYSNSDEIQVILGYQYKDYYNLNDKIKCIYNEKSHVLNVVGILEKNSITIDNFMDMANSRCLDRDIILPNSYTDNITKLTNAIVYFPDKNFDSNKITKYTTSLGLSLSYNTCNDLLSKDITTIKADTPSFNLFILLIMGVSFILMLIIMLVYVKRNIKEYSVHILNGATIFDIQKRVIIELLLLLLLAFPISVILICTVFRDFIISYYFVDFKFILITFLILIIITLFTAVIPIIRISRMNLSKLLGEE